MKNILGIILAGVGTMLATISTGACPIVFVDEPKMSKKMLEK